MDEVVSVQVFCTDLKLHETFNAAYKTDTIPPGRSSGPSSFFAVEGTK